MNKRTIDIIGKIQRLSDGKIKYYQVHSLLEVQDIIKHCNDTQTKTFVYSKVTCFYTRLYNSDDDFSLESEFYECNSKQLEHESGVYICVYKGYYVDNPCIHNKPEKKFVLVNRMPSMKTF